MLTGTQKSTLVLKGLKELSCNIIHRIKHFTNRLLVSKPKNVTKFLSDKRPTLRYKELTVAQMRILRNSKKNCKLLKRPHYGLEERTWFKKSRCTTTQKGLWKLMAQND